MKILLVANGNDIKKLFKDYFVPRGHEIISYNNPIKAMDNYQEVDPEIVLFKRDDFPRHWSLALKFLREEKSRKDTLFILLLEQPLTTAEVDKAHFLGVNALFVQPLETKEDVAALEKTIARYKPVKINTDLIFRPDRQKPVEFSFVDPQSYRIVTGQFTSVSHKGGGFQPDEKRSVLSLKPQESLKCCVLKAGDHLISLDATVLSNNGLLEIAFDNVNLRKKRELEKALGA